MKKPQPIVVPPEIPTVTRWDGCVFRKLSDSLDYSYNVGYWDDRNYEDPIKVVVRILDKATGATRQRIEIDTVGRIDFSCFATSALKGKDQTGLVADGDFGRIHVADFNLDGREDFTVNTDLGAAYWYDYYLQGEDGQWHHDEWLSEHVSYTARVDTSTGILCTQGRAGVCCLGVNYYQYDSLKSAWKKTRRVVRELDNGRITEDIRY